MTVHSYHPDSHTHGLSPGCPRCEEHAQNPRVGLDRENVARLLSGEVLTPLDQAARDVLMRTNGGKPDQSRSVLKREQGLDALAEVAGLSADLAALEKVREGVPTAQVVKAAVRAALDCLEKVGLVKLPTEHEIDRVWSEGVSP